MWSVNVLAAFVWVATWCACVAACLAAQAQQPERTPVQARIRVIYKSTQPISERLLPGDEIVQIEQDWEFVVSTHDPSAQSVIDWYSARAAHVIVMEIRDVAGVPHDEGRWIRTKATGVVLDVLKSSDNRRISLNESIEVQALGGELRFGSVLARTADAMSLTPTRRYLMFLNFTDEWNGFHAESIFLIDSDNLVNLSPVNPYSKRLNGVRLSEVRKRINAHSKPR